MKVVASNGDVVALRSNSRRVRLCAAGTALAVVLFWILDEVRPKAFLDCVPNPNPYNPNQPEPQS